MIIRDLKTVLSQKREATLSELAVELESDRPMVRAAIDFWRERGRIEVITTESEAVGAASVAAGTSASCAGACGGCVLTPFCASPAVRYRWKSVETGDQSIRFCTSPRE